MKKIIFAVFLILFACQFAFASEVGHLTYAEGRVDITHSESEASVPVRKGEAVLIGDSIRTKSNSKAEVTFNDNSVIRLAQNSKITVKDYQFDSHNKRLAATIMLDRGKVRTIVSRMPYTAAFNIETPNAMGVVKGSDVFAFYNAGTSSLLVSEGKLSVINTAHPDGEIVVPPGMSVLIPQEGLPKGPREYFEIEKRLYERDTNVPVSKPRDMSDTAIRGVITKFSGDVRIARKDDASERAVNLNDILSEGDRIVTGKDGFIAIKLDNGNAINLKPDTELVLVKLIMNPKTGEYENSFYSSQGRIRARIENLKGGSTFKIATPVAISGARGTIMYTEIMQNMTRAFFEGGNGYITGILKNMTKEIPAGQNASVYSNGDLTDPQNTSDEERMKFTDGWEPGNGIEGYSMPEGGLGIYLFTFYNDWGYRGYAGPVPGIEGAGREDVPFRDVYGLLTQTIASSGEEAPVTFASEFYSRLIYPGRVYVDDGYILGILGGTTSSLWDNTPDPITAAGYLNSYGYNGLHIWGSGIYHGADDGGGYFGFIEGVQKNSLISVLLKAFYFAPPDSEGFSEYGFLSAGTEGNVDEGAGIFVMNGTMVKEAKGTVWLGDFEDAEGLEDFFNYTAFVGFGKGDFTGDGAIDTAYSYGLVISLSGEKWGLSYSALGGPCSDIGTSFRLALGERSYDESLIGVLGIVSGAIDGEALTGTYKGIWMCPADGIDEDSVRAGIVNGDLSGYIDVKEDSGTWHAAATGEWVEVTDLLTTEQLGFDMTELNDFVSVPITEAYSSIAGINGSFNGGAGNIAGAMDMSFYANTAAQNNGIWAATVSGLYSGMPNEVASWSAVITGNTSAGQISANINGMQWSDNQWHGTIESDESSNINFSGEAAGTYAPADSTSGSFTGVGAGTWETLTEVIEVQR